MMKTVASVASKAVGKLKGTAPSSGPTPAKATKEVKGTSAANQGAPLKAKPAGAALKPAAATTTAGELLLKASASECDCTSLSSM